MNKENFISAVAEKASLTKKDAKVVVDSILDLITETLSNGESIQLTGFGGFETRIRSARIGRNPQTGEEIHIPATRVPVFKAGKCLKDAVK